MTASEALQTIIEHLNVPQTLRDDNLTQKQIKLRNSVQILQDFVKEHDQPNEQ
jgi:hypothetical protein